MRTLAALLLVAAAACAHETPRSPGPPVRTLAVGALEHGTYTTAAVRRTFTVEVPEDGVWTSDGETEDGFTLRTASAAMGVVAFPRGATTPDALLKAFRTTPGLTKSDDEVTRPVDGNDAWHLTWNVSRDATVNVGGETFRFTRGERNHAIVVSAPNAPVLVLMAATNAGFDTVYTKGHVVVFAMGIGP